MAVSFDDSFFRDHSTFIQRTGPGQFFIYQKTVGKGITAILCRAKPESELILGDRKILLCIIIFNSSIECVVHKMGDVRGGDKGKFTIRVVSMGRFIQKVRFTNPQKKGIQPYISGSTGLVKDCVFALLINLDVPLRKFML